MEPVTPALSAQDHDEDRHGAPSPDVSIIVPAFNEGATISENLAAMVETFDAAGLDYEVVCVSDGSSDDTLSRAAAVGASRVRTIGYAPNQGKGHALRTGSLQARGTYVAWLDSDLDIDPAGVADYRRRIESQSADVVIGSKRHPDSLVDYPRRRRIYSALYQALVRVLFGLKVRDTQVGIKMFRREVLDEVLPLVLVKRYAFDLEVLVVANHLGFTHITEAPVSIDYKFSGSNVNWRAIRDALWDTAAVFYRLRIRRSYERVTPRGRNG